MLNIFPSLSGLKEEEERERKITLKTKKIKFFLSFVYFVELLLSHKITPKSNNVGLEK